ncbi:hypothetical protein FOA52_008122 [Chlamydomonas sp. UWO 241]|nr:hypothetical protein FOA52_008122 [Chlamydomonas sp. UWO 241]
MILPADFDADLPTFALTGGEVKTVSAFKYLGSWITQSGGVEKEIGVRVGRALGVFASFDKIWASKKMQVQYDAVVKHQHYVPILETSAEDVLQIVPKLRKEDAKTKAIAEAGRARVISLLSKPARLCFWKTLIEEMARLQKYRPSCRLHKMCVPVKDEIEYLGYYEPKSYECYLHNALDALLGTHEHAGGPGGAKNSSRNAESPWGVDYGMANSSHGYAGWFVHESTEPLGPEDLVSDWTPPEWAAAWVPEDEEVNQERTWPGKNERRRRG